MTAAQREVFKPQKWREPTLEGSYNTLNNTLGSNAIYPITTVSLTPASTSYIAANVLQKGNS